MPALHIQVSLLDGPNKSYVFDTFPVRIGRSIANHLQIDHEAVPRELCIAWLETDNRTVRVEERPGLTNPLVAGKTRVQGGISGRRLHLKAGPATICFSSEAILEKPENRQRASGAIIALSVGVAFIVIAGGKPKASGKRDTDLFSILPKSPLCVDTEIRCNDMGSCAQRARLLRERAVETLSRRSISMLDRVNAVMQLKESVQVCGAEDSSACVSSPKALRDAEAGLADAYQQELMRLRTAVEGKVGKDVVHSARNIKAAIEKCDARATDVLERLIETYRESVDAK